jgi:hypothetical protein
MTNAGRDAADPDRLESVRALARHPNVQTEAEARALLAELEKRLGGDGGDTWTPEKGARTFAELYGPDDLEASRAADLLRVDCAPGHPGTENDPAHPHGWGWGKDIGNWLGGGLHQGAVVGVVAARAKAGKTSFLAQLADGLALRCAASLAPEAFGVTEYMMGTDCPAELGGLPAAAVRNDPLTPVVWLSEMSQKALTWRTLARWTGKPSGWFRAGAAARRMHKPAADVDAAFTAAKRALADGAHLRRGMTCMRFVNPAGAGLVAVDRARRAADLWRTELAQTAPGRDVWPVVVVDPLQRFQSPDAANEVGAMNELIEALARAADDDGFCLLLTSDTQKESAKGNPAGGDDQKAAHWARGSYKLIHLCDAVLALERYNAPPPKNKDATEVKPPALDRGRYYMQATVDVNRWGPSGAPEHAALFEWAAPSGRWRALGTQKDLEVTWRKERATAEPATGNGTAKGGKKTGGGARRADPTEELMG